MRIIPPRLNHLLHILLRSRDPVSVQELGSLLGVSRRTVFRELENIDLLLGSFGLSIGTITGRGVALEGWEEGRKHLREELNSSGNQEPAGRQERQNQLALGLLLTPEPQKLFYFADQLRVSEATISNDLDRLEEWFGSYRLTLLRKQSFGVGVEGEESGIRRACVSLLHKQGETRQPWVGTPFQAIAGPLQQQETLAHLCHWMTPESLEALTLYLLVMVHRIQGGCEVEAQQPSMGHRENGEAIACLLEETFDLPISQRERDALTVELSACRNNTTAIPRREANRDSQLLHLSYQLIEAFDPVVASILKLDEDLLDGLVFHLRSAQVRLEHHVELRDPLLEQIAQSYPDLMIKSRRAATLLYEPGSWMPEDEISFLAMHFGAALHRLEERGIRRRTMRIGIVCLNGIGTSYMLAAQVRKHFEADTTVEVSGWESPEEWSRYDLLISTIPLRHAQVPVITVPPFLAGDSIRRIREEIDRRAVLLHQQEPQKRQGDSLTVRFAALSSLSGDLQALLEQFDAIPVEANCTFEDLAKLAGYRFGDGEQNGRLIYEGLMERERLSTQIVTEMGIVLLHCRTAGVSQPVFALLTPEGGSFVHPYFCGVQSCVLLLAPNYGSRERTELMGCISSALIERQAFLNAILAHDEALVLDHLQDILQHYLTDYLKKHWKG